MLFSYGSGRQQIDGKNKKEGRFLAILIAMVMQQFDMGCIAR
jgi:hypothetical protein